MKLNKGWIITVIGGIVTGVLIVLIVSGTGNAPS